MTARNSAMLWHSTGAILCGRQHLPRAGGECSGVFRLWLCTQSALRPWHAAYNILARWRFQSRFWCYSRPRLSHSLHHFDKACEHVDYQLVSQAGPKLLTMQLSLSVCGPYEIKDGCTGNNQKVSLPASGSQSVTNDLPPWVTG